MLCCSNGFCQLHAEILHLFFRQKAGAHILSDLLNGYGEEDSDNELEFDSARMPTEPLATANAAVDLRVATLEDKRAQPDRESTKEPRRRRGADLRDPR